ncbi:MAG TPA: tRNA (adenosine(37)-N6)-threonylcarbamoyltransferase complex dimerization subunit type 1 TsaB [Caldimonas sp.]|nr:tRNA (adenosine(37)-N6)-threonylcarbamoyltransferase complex dimerization subunit type 1 TsaB [Caldimonas sp.]
MTVLLAFDTATERTAIALGDEGRAWLREGAGGARASATFLPAVLDVLRDAGLRLEDVAAIAYGRGPGAFTGLRVASAVAQGLALGARKPVLALDTLMAVAEDARMLLAAGCEGDVRFDLPIAVWAVQDARMDEVYAGEYVRDGDRWWTRRAPRVLAPEALVAEWQQLPPSIVAGNALPAFGTRLDTGLAVRVPEAAPRAGALLALARTAWAAGERLDAADALPLYVRDKVALTSAERGASR